MEVVDEIDVKPGEIPKGTYTEDMARDTREHAKANGDELRNSLDEAWIHTKIAGKLIAARSIRPRPKAEASRVAMDTDGVRKVNNLLRVRAR